MLHSVFTLVLLTAALVAAEAAAKTATHPALDHLHHHHQLPRQHRRILNDEDVPRHDPLQRCGAATPPPEQVAAFEEQLDIFIHTKTRPQTTSPINITVIFHVITDGNDGNITDEAIIKQLEILNQGYKDTPFVFLMGGITRTNNASWMYVRPGKAEEKEMKTALRQGGPDVLNVYFALPMYGWFGALLGFASFPFGQMWLPWSDPEQLALDGVVINYGSVPGGDLQGYNLGATLVHEEIDVTASSYRLCRAVSGHWFGLYHTFEGECVVGRRGDYIDDTPAEKSPSSNCEAKDTCTGLRFPGEDPVRNYMDYSPDECLDHFTPGQIERMVYVWFASRAPKEKE